MADNMQAARPELAYSAVTPNKPKMLADTQTEEKLGSIINNFSNFDGRMKYLTHVRGCSRLSVQ
jgi:hypothetical protein